MRIIDFHTHVFPDELAAAAVAHLEAEGGVSACYDGSVGGLVRAMKRAGVDTSVILPVATKATQVERINDWAATLADMRIVPFGAMHPDVPDVAREIARMRQLGLRGFKLHPEYQSFDPAESRLAPIWEAAAEQRMIVVSHAGGDIAFETVRGTAAAFAAVVEDWPQLRLVLAHMGGFRCWGEVAGVLAGLDLWLDTSYTLGHLPDEDFLELVRLHGAGRVLFGSDGPWTDAGAEIAHLKRLGLTEVELSGVLGENARKLLAECA